MQPGRAAHNAITSAIAAQTNNMVTRYAVISSPQISHRRSHAGSNTQWTNKHSKDTQGHPTTPHEGHKYGE